MNSKINQKQAIMKYKIITFLILLCFVLLLPKGVNAARAPIHQAKQCWFTGGFYIEYHCWCPPFTDNDRGSCFIRSYEESCNNIGGEVRVEDGRREPYRYRECVKNGEKVKPNTIPALFLWWFIPVIGIIIYLLRKMRKKN